MKISQKLFTIACSAALSIALCGAVGLFSINELSNSLHFVNNKTIPSMDILNEVMLKQQQMAIIQYRYVQSNDAAQKSQFSMELESLSRDIRKEMAAYEPLITSAKGREMYQAEQAKLEEYLDLTKQFFEKSNSGDIAGALELAKPAGTKRAELAKLLGDHIQRNKDLAANETRESDKMISIAKILTGGIVPMAMIAVSLICFFIIKSIRLSLQSIQSAVARIEGDLDFTSTIKIIGKDEIAEVCSQLNRLFSKLRNNLLTISSGAERIANTAAHMATAAEQVAVAAAHQSDSASNMAASVEEMTVSISHVSERSEEAHQLSSSSGQMAREGSDVIRKTVEDISAIAQSVEHVSMRVQELENHGNNISSIVSVIKEVAEQTNLLALNAAIEAARAGEQGRGFAVVADEVRQLAERTSRSTAEIAKTVDAIRNLSHDASASMKQAEQLVLVGVSRAGDADKSITAIGQESTQAMTMVEEITTAIREQSVASNNIAGRVENVAQMAEESSAAAQNTATAARELDKLASDMRAIVGAYKL